MAAKKTEEPMEIMETVEEKKVSLIVPREPGGEEMLFVALNGKAYNIPRGKVVEIPEDVARVYYNSVAAEENAWKNSMAMQAEMNTVQGAP